MEGACCTACTLTMGQRWAMGCPVAGVPFVSSNTFGLSSKNARIGGNQAGLPWLQAWPVGLKGDPARRRMQGRGKPSARRKRGRALEGLLSPVVPCCLFFPCADCLAVKQAATRSGPTIQRCHTRTTPPTRNRTQRADSWFQAWLAFMVCVISRTNTLEPSFCLAGICSLTLKLFRSFHRYITTRSGWTDSRSPNLAPKMASDITAVDVELSRGTPLTAI